jgi:YD repeat-containing protein
LSIVAIVFVGYLGSIFWAFLGSFFFYSGIIFGSLRSDVLYMMGEPTWVRSSSPPEWRKAETSTIGAFQQWAYTLNDAGRVTVEFDTNGRVSRITCLDKPGSYRASCPSLVGLNINDHEDDILKRLGAPERQHFVGTTKILYYSDIGVEFQLTRSRVYGITLLQGNGGGIAKFGRFVNTLTPW